MGLITYGIGSLANGLDRLGKHEEMFVNLSDSSERRLEKTINRYAAMGYRLVDGIHRDRDWVYRCSMQMDPAIYEQKQAEARAKQQQEMEARREARQKAWNFVKKTASKLTKEEEKKEDKKKK